LLNDGTSAVSLLYDRLIDQYGVQIFAAAGNSGPGLTSVNDPSVATRVMSVGAYVHSDTLRSLYGIASANLEGLFTFSSRGPRADGGFKPEIVAPGAALSSVPGWQGDSSLLGKPLPPGYATFAGTSMAAPQAAGGAALLLSAARQSSMQVNTDQVRQAISSGARYLSGYGAHEQGAGIFQVGAAWSLLRAGIQPVAITSSAPINHSLSPRLVLPNHGPGIYEREGWAAGQSGERTITFTRTSGPAGPVTYNLSFTGNDGAFTTGRSITLPLNTPTRLAVTVAPATPGVHSAVLNLDDPATPGIEYRVLNTVVAAEQMPEPDTFATSVSGTVAPIDRTTFYYHVPAGTGAFEVRMRVASGSVRMTRVEPAGLPIESSFYCSAGADCESGVGWVIRTISDPTPGVWEVTLEAAPDATARPAAFTIAGLLLGVSAEPSTWAVDPAPVGSTVSRNLTFTNRFRPYTGTSTGTNLDSVFTARPTIAQGGQWTSTVQVEPLSTSLTAKIGNFSDPRADLRLYALDPSGRPVDLPISNPAPGRYTVVVEAVSVPAGLTQFDYEDYF
ncbi:MAG TPA: S8 family serine peptidase, partial [Actinomycetes bacterium]|nr:S8 family serine peptidase [Actinomycetes bacterium]